MTAVSGVTQTGATSGGNVTSDGNATVTARGVVWGTAANPTISDSKTSDGSGTGAFTSALSGLTRNTVYHVRAYATNSVGTTYTADTTFTTLADLPTVTTTAASGMTRTAASAAGMSPTTAEEPSPPAALPGAPARTRRSLAPSHPMEPGPVPSPAA